MLVGTFLPFKLQVVDIKRLANTRADDIQIIAKLKIIIYTPQRNATFFVPSLKTRKIYSCILLHPYPILFPGILGSWLSIKSYQRWPWKNNAQTHYLPLSYPTIINPAFNQYSINQYSHPQIIRSSIHISRFILFIVQISIHPFIFAVSSTAHHIHSSSYPQLIISADSFSL